MIQITHEPLDPESITAAVRKGTNGAVVTFLGSTRSSTGGRNVLHLEYEAYPEMAVREMDKIVAEAAKRWPGSRVAIGHRTGHLAIGEIAVVIAAAAPHRAEAFEACRFAIDTLKETVPIWKREVATDGAYWVDDRP